MASYSTILHTLSYNALSNASDYASEVILSARHRIAEMGTNFVDTTLLQHPPQPYRRLTIVTSAVLLLFILTYSLSTLKFRNAIRNHVPGGLPPTVPYWLPLLYHVIPLAWNTADFVASIVKKYGYHTPLEVRVGFLNFCIVSDPEQTQTVFQSSKRLSSKPVKLQALKMILGAPARVIPFYAADDSGVSANPRKGSTTRPEDRIYYHQINAAQKYLSGQSVLKMSERYMSILSRHLDALDVQSEWVELTDLYHFLHMQVTRAAIESIMGSYVLSLNPTLVEDFCQFDNNAPNFIRGLPRWLIPSAYKARDRLLESIKKWHAFAHENSDCSKLEPQEPEWDPYFGTKLVKARQNFMSKMTPLDTDAKASEDLGLIFASNTNAVPSIFWFLFEALKDSDLRARLMVEASTCKSSSSDGPGAGAATGGFEITKLASQPLLQSTYAEVLRLRVAVGVMRTDEYDDFELGDYTIPRRKPILMFSRTAALNREAWAVRERLTQQPLNRFWPERFLIYPEEDATSPKPNHPPPSTSPYANPNPEAESKTETETAAPSPFPALPQPRFSLDGLANAWFPYGGGQRMCPGRHFAKHEILGTFALLFSRFEMELRYPQDAQKLRPDMRRFSLGGLPPVGKVPVWIRRRQGGF